MEKISNIDQSIDNQTQNLFTVTNKEELPVAPEEKKNSSEILIFLRDICIILGIVLILRTYIASPFRINGSSMESNYHNNELIIVDKISYNLGIWDITNNNPQRGDVVVIQPHSIAGKDFFIKRIVGMPGDKLKIEDGYVYIKTLEAANYIKLNENYLNEENLGKTFPGRSSLKTEFNIPDNEYFILGDNRNGSSDSRDCFYTCSNDGSSHFIKRKDIIGRLWVTLGAIRFLESKNVLINDTGTNENIHSSSIFSVTPRFLETPATWNYPELQ